MCIPSFNIESNQLEKKSYPLEMFFNMLQSKVLIRSCDKNPCSNSKWHASKYASVSAASGASTGEEF